MVSEKKHKDRQEWALPPHYAFTSLTIHKDCSEELHNCKSRNMRWVEHISGTGRITAYKN